MADDGLLAHSQIAPLAFKLAVRDALFRRLSETPPETVSSIANDANDFVAYCANNFPRDRKNAARCAAGILAKLDSQKHTERYSAYNMNSMFDIRRCAIRLLQDEDGSTNKDAHGRHHCPVQRTVQRIATWKTPSAACSRAPKT